MIQIIVVNGMPGCGKTTFERYCMKELAPYADMYSTVDFVKEVAAMCGWDGTKTLENRAFLSDLKDLLTKWNDIPFKKVEDKAIQFENELSCWGLNDKVAYLFVDCREPNEIQRLCDELGAISVCVRRSEVENKETSNHADRNVLNYKYDYTLYNEDNLSHFYNVIDDFLTVLQSWTVADTI